MLKNKYIQKILFNNSLGSPVLQKVHEQKWLKPYQYMWYYLYDKSIKFNVSLRHFKKDIKEFNWFKSVTSASTIEFNTLDQEDKRFFGWTKKEDTVTLFNLGKSRLDIWDNVDNLVEFADKPFNFDMDLWRYRFDSYGSYWEPIFSMWNLWYSVGLKTNLGVLMPLMQNYFRFKLNKKFNIRNKDYSYLLDNSFNDTVFTYTGIYYNHYFDSSYEVSDYSIDIYSKFYVSTHDILNNNEDVFISTYNSNWYDLFNTFSNQRVSDYLEEGSLPCRSIIVANDQYLSNSFFINGYDSNTFLLSTNKYFEKIELNKLFSYFCNWSDNLFFNKQRIVIGNNLFVKLFNKVRRFNNNLLFNILDNNKVRLIIYYLLSSFTKVKELNYYTYKYLINLFLKINLLNTYMYSNYKKENLNLNKFKVKNYFLQKYSNKYMFYSKLEYLNNLDLNLFNTLNKFKSKLFKYGFYLFLLNKNYKKEKFEYPLRLKGYMKSSDRMFSNFRYIMTYLNPKHGMYLYRKWGFIQSEDRMYMNFNSINKSFYPYKTSGRYVRKMYKEVYSRFFYSVFVLNLQRFLGVSYNFILSNDTDIVLLYNMADMKIYLLKFFQLFGKLEYFWKDIRYRKMYYPELLLIMKGWRWYYLNPYRFNSIEEWDDFFLSSFKTQYNISLDLNFLKFKKSRMLRFLWMAQSNDWPLFLITYRWFKRDRSRFKKPKRIEERIRLVSKRIKELKREFKFLNNFRNSYYADILYQHTRYDRNGHINNFRKMWARWSRVECKNYNLKYTNLNYKGRNISWFLFCYNFKKVFRFSTMHEIFKLESVDKYLDTSNVNKYSSKSYLKRINRSLIKYEKKTRKRLNKKKKALIRHKAYAAKLFRRYYIRREVKKPKSTKRLKLNSKEVLSNYIKAYSKNRRRYKKGYNYNYKKLKGYV